ncbi:MAG: HAMP domain-containing histidine kinase, partial [Chloroflexi bacterium]|nr:HAMP domain-containing histidine kinase [Chloroflexota bacterium]
GALARELPREQLRGLFDAQLAIEPGGVRALMISYRDTRLAILSLVMPNAKSLPAPPEEVVEVFCSQAALAIENALLYERLSQRSDDLQHAYAALESAHGQLVQMGEMKSNFLANVSHELRTPLTSIRAFSDLLLDDVGVEADLKTEFVTIINGESERLTRMVEDVLDITKIESGSMDWALSTVDLNSLLAETLKIYGPQAESRGLKFQHRIQQDLPAVDGDRDRLRQVINNLLSNALKFTEEGWVELHAWSQAGQVHLAVADSGVGILPADRDRIFEKFQQVNTQAARSSAGTGLGLSICREIVEYHGGRIWVESAVGGGSIFYVDLPVTTRREQPAESVRLG